MKNHVRNLLSGSILVVLVVSMFCFFNSAEAAININGYDLVQAESTQTFTFGDITLESGDWVIVGRNATQAEFETFWGVTLPSDVTYINSENSIPMINGDETFTLLDASDGTVDGPTVALVSGESVRRNNTSDPAGDETSWTRGDANTTATPGEASGVKSSSGLVITEFSDATGTGNYVYEFVEIYYDAGPNAVNFVGLTVDSPLRFVWIAISGVLLGLLVFIRRWE